MRGCAHLQIAVMKTEYKNRQIVISPDPLRDSWFILAIDGEEYEAPYLTDEKNLDYARRLIDGDVV